ncbi:adenylate kinase [Afifella marina]|uniref:Adenylate kinase n=1 Tax=Afifella marina DSM 2698 TaxID=1120955 RepID=A0A1G5N4D4_AFIMA|nr:adenylate kinase [Afifella marina]MBK1622379.1 adenylate kinase [Afifella marina DSM 2698]MBK1626907.1 adenylate kinase [Afifella marina]MBK5919163.1 adenylate kinase [Afifella marina]RAI21212.1 adenylate kinase [Afifella marina DSM 2698]SCZ31778.1 Adenylate kinase [Afifella marina DSM 2698]
MDRTRLYLTGASCSGVSTLGTLLAERFGVPHLDVDDFYWMPTDPPFSTKRPPEDRVRLIQERQAASQGWVLTGSFIGWGDALIDHVDLIVFLKTPTSIRLQRLDRREAERHGARILPGGDMHEAHLAFRDWASRYDDPTFTGRNIAQHERWLSTQSAPVLRLSGERPSDELADDVKGALAHLQSMRLA